jgi:adenylate cyclase
MATIEFAPSQWGEGVSVERPEGGALIDICDDARAPVAFSCRSASCGTCRVEVQEGAELLEPALREERDVLEIFAAPPSHRLACQARVRGGPGRVLLRSVDED